MNVIMVPLSSVRFYFNGCSLLNGFVYLDLCNSFSCVMLKLYVNFSKPGYRCCGGRTDHRIEAIAGQVEAVADLAAERRRGGEYAELLSQVVAGDREVGQQVRDLVQQ